MDVIAGRNLLKILEAFWPSADNIVLDYITIINVLPNSNAQPLHADLEGVSNHLELHFPLVNITPQTGPTRFCPATHVLAGNRSGTLASWGFASPAKLCEAEDPLSYSFDHANVGIATLYDASVIH